VERPNEKTLSPEAFESLKGIALGAVNTVLFISLRIGRKDTKL
jgi:hypothetical protein